MYKTRKDPKGRVLKKGETYSKGKNLYVFSYTDPCGKRNSFYANDIKELRDKEEVLQRNLFDGIDAYLLAKADVNYVFDRYIETKYGIKNSTKANYIYAYNKYVRDTLGKRKLSTVRYSDVVLFYKTLLDKGLSAGTIDNVHTVLHSALQIAVRDNIIRMNPADGAMAEVKRRIGRVSSRHSLTYEQEKAFLDYIENNPNEERWVALFTVMFGTGCRIGEIIGLRWDDVDFENRIININHNVTYGPRVDNSFKCEFDVTLPKTKAGIRNIPMLDKVYNVLVKEKSMQEQKVRRSNYELAGMKNFVFYNRYGSIHNPSSINRVIKRIVNDYNNNEILQAISEDREPVIIPQFSCHIARHTFCSRLCENDSNIKLIQQVMGHKDIQTTLDIYSEISEYKCKEIFEGLNYKNVI